MQNIPLKRTTPFSDVEIADKAKEMAKTAAKTDMKRGIIRYDLAMYAAIFADMFVTINKEFYSQRALAEVVRTSARFAVEFANWYGQFTHVDSF